MKEQASLTAKDILGNPDYLAMSYGGYRHVDHDIEPTIDELKEDMKFYRRWVLKFYAPIKCNYRKLLIY